MADDDRAGDPARSSHSGGSLLRDLVVVVVSAVVIALVIKTFFLQVFYVPSESMRDTLQVNDRIVVQKWSYWSGGPERGDVVVFSDPGGWLPPTADDQGPVAGALSALGFYPAGGHLVKRVVGVGGDRITCRRGTLLVNGEPQRDESYVTLARRGCTSRFDVRVPEGSLWVMGDNRSASADSRAHLAAPGGGFVPVENVVGRVEFIAWPLDRLGTVD